MDIKQTTSNHSDQNSDVQKINIVEEMNTLNQRIQNPSNEIYKISSSWDKHPNDQNNKNIEIMIKEMMNYMIKMDNTLTKMDTALTKTDIVLTKIETAFSKSENKRETKSFWNNFRL